MKRSHRRHVGEEDEPSFSTKALKMDGSIASAFTCPVCLAFYKDPVILKCGHALCLPCEEKIRRTGKKACPVCRAEYSTPTNEVTPNISLRKALANLPKEGDAFHVGETCIHVGSFTESAEKCPHCDKSFCAVCMHCHLDRVQLEMKWLYGSFAHRLTSAMKGLEEDVSKAKKLISSELKDQRANIRRETNELMRILKQEQAELLKEVDSYEKEQVSVVDNFLKTSKGLPDEVKDVEELLNETRNASLLLSSAKQIGDVNQAVIAVDHKIYRMEHFRSNFSQFECPIDFEPLKTTMNEGLRMQRSDVLFPCLVPTRSTESLRLESAMTSGKIAEVKKFYEKRQTDPRMALELFVNSEMLRFEKDNAAMISENRPSIPRLPDGENGSGSKTVKKMDAVLATPLVKAIELGNVTLVRYLVDKCGADIFRKQGSASGDMALHSAVLFDRFHIMKYLVAHDQACVDAQNDNQETALNIATKKGNVGLVKFLIETAHANPQLPDNNEFSPLTVAAAKNNGEVFKYLVERPGVLDDGSMEAIGRVAVDYKSADVVRYLFTKSGRSAAIPAILRRLETL